MIARFRAAAPDFPPAEYENVFTNARGERLVIAWRSAPAARRDGQGRPDRRRRPRHHAAQAAGGGAARLARADRRGRRRRAAPARAQPPRRRAAAARRALARAAARAGEGRRRPGRAPASCSPARARSSPRRSRSCASSRAASIPAVLTDRGLRAALEGARRAHAAAGRARRCPTSACPSRSRRPRTTSSPRRSRTSSSTRGATSVDVARRSAPNGTRRDRGRRRRRRRGRRRAGGSGLRGLADRVAALDGRLSVESPPGGGTRVVAEIPSAGGSADAAAGSAMSRDRAVDSADARRARRRLGPAPRGHRPPARGGRVRGRRPGGHRRAS